SFFNQCVTLDATVDPTTVKLEIWDTAGQEKYHSVCHLYYRGANAALLVYDIARKESFEKAKVWLSELEKEFLQNEIVIILVGNKLDLSEEREVTIQAGGKRIRKDELHIIHGNLGEVRLPSDRALCDASSRAVKTGAAEREAASHDAMEKITGGFAGDDLPPNDMLPEIKPRCLNKAGVTVVVQDSFTWRRLQHLKQMLCP
ncbi:UNVERIFIED_CONTAM: hypothetical protein K2H54_043478, partial [Gekko kuhli]